MYIATKPGLVYYLDPGDASPHLLLDKTYAERSLRGSRRRAFARATRRPRTT